MLKLASIIKYPRFFVPRRNLSVPAKAPPPKLDVKWFYATDIPRSKPRGFDYVQTQRAAKFLPFSRIDSDNLEKCYQKWKSTQIDPSPVAVNEDKLFDCDLLKMEIRPTFWDGPTYEIRRGTWFLNKEPLPGPISEQLEKAYLELVPQLTEAGDADDVEPFTAEIESEVNVYERTTGSKWPLENPSDFELKDKVVVFKDTKVAYLVEKDFKLGKIQVKNFNRLPTQQVIGAATVVRGYDKSVEKEGENVEGNESVNESSTNSQEPDLMDTIKRGIGSNEKLQDDMEHDFTNNPGHIASSGDREVDHLILCVHGIGQFLGSRFDGVNFAHDCSSMRKTMKKLFVSSPKYAKLAYSEEELKNGKEVTDNCKVQVLPIVWRYDIDFSLDKVDEEIENDGHPRLPTLAQLNVEAITPIRHLAADVVMDILLFYDPKFKKQILSTVVRSANELYDKYLERHPNFNGKVSMLAHSLGSAICLDILSQQPENIPTGDDFCPDSHLKFDVENLFGVGSPNGVFKFIKGQNIRPRALYPLEEQDVEAAREREVQSPRVNNYYNIFYSTDPVAYRVEPLIHSSLASFKPKGIPFSDEKGFNSQLHNLANLPKEILKADFLKRAAEFTGVGQELLYKEGDKEVQDTSETDDLGASLDEHVLDMLRKMNKTGRVDYSLPQSLFGIDMLDAIGSHIQYLDDPDVSGFILSQLWLNRENSEDFRGKKYTKK